VGGGGACAFALRTPAKKIGHRAGWFSGQKSGRAQNKNDFFFVVFELPFPGKAPKSDQKNTGIKQPTDLLLSIFL
jgi:hypothetical protein